MKTKNTLQTAYVLHTRSYRETSLIIDVLTLEHGRMGLVAKGAKRPKSAHKGLLQPFMPLLISSVGRGELKTLTHVEVQTQRLLLQGNYLVSGLYINELLTRLLLKDEPCPFIFAAYEQVLADLYAQVDLNICLRLFEKNLLKALGYELNLAYEAKSGAPVEPSAQYLYILDQGPVKVAPGSQPDDHVLLFNGQHLLDLHHERLNTPDSQQQAKRLLRQAIQQQLGHKPLQSRHLLSKMACFE